MEQDIRATRLAPAKPSFTDWVAQNTRTLAIAGTAVVAGAAIFWFVNRSATLKAENAEKALLTAKQSYGSGNAALAQSDLTKLTQRYDGTRAAGEAALLLAQLQYDAGKFGDGVATLQKVDAGDGIGAATLEALKADGLASQQKFAEAAEAYGRAANATTFAQERETLLAKQARMLMDAKKPADAIAIWERLENATAREVAAEAKIRLGELRAKPVGA